MKKVNSINLIVLLTMLPSMAYSLELDVKVSELRYEGDKRAHELVEKTLVGHINAPSFRINTPRANFVLKNNFEFSGAIFRKDNWLILDNDMFELTYSINDIPKFDKIRFADFKNLSLFTDDLSLNLMGERGEFHFDESTFLIENIDFDCGLENNIIDGSESIIESCLNNSTISKFDKNESNTHIVYNSGLTQTSFRLDDLKVREKELLIKAQNLAVANDKFIVGTETVSLECPKNHYQKDFNDKLAVASCLERASIHAPRIVFEAPDNDMRGEVEVEKLISNGKRMHFLGPYVSIVNGEQTIEFSNLDAFCKLPPLGQGFEYNHLIHGCMDSSAIVLNQFNMNDAKGHVKVESASLKFFGDRLRLETPDINIWRDGSQYRIKNISYSCKNIPFSGGFENQQIAEGCFEESIGSIEDFSMEDANSAIVLKTANLNVNKNKLIFNAPVLTFLDTLGSLKVDFVQPSIECSRVNTEDISAENILRGCFDSSKINVQSIDIKHERIDSEIQIKEVSIDKRELRFNSPKGKYVLNGFDNVYKNFKVNCALNASYDVAKNYDWESILENCLHSTKIKLDSLQSIYNGDSTMRKFGNAVKNFGIKGVNKVTFDSSSVDGTDFKLNISPEVFSFIPIHVTINGNIYYLRGEKKIVMDVKNTYFYKIIPARFLVQLILNAFVADENIEVDDNKIIINIPVEDKN